MKDILKTSSAEEENILGNLALSPPAEEEDILATQFHPFSTLPWDDQYPLHHPDIIKVPERGKTPPKIDPSLVLKRLNRQNIFCSITPIPLNAEKMACLG